MSGGVTVTDLNVVTWGHGDPMVMVHGSGPSWGEETWAEQRPLSDVYRLQLIDRRGFGDSPPAEGEDFEVDAEDIAEILGRGAHLVGHSYGGLGCLLAAARRPEAVVSLTVIEPPAFSLTRGTDASDDLAGRLRAVFESQSTVGPERFWIAFLEAFGLEPGDTGFESWAAMTSQLPARDLVGIETTRRERVPFWEPVIPVEDLASAPFPKLVVSGDWTNVGESARRIAGRAFGEICDALARAIGAERAVIPGAAHGPQLSRPEAFNNRLRSFLDSASRHSLPDS
jgi:pimeloyl-ACP methyl ester carboxylesterase